MSGLPKGWATASINSFVNSRSGNSKLIKGKLYKEPLGDLFPAFSASGQDVWVEDPEHEGDAIIVSAVGARCGKTFVATGKWSAIANTHIVSPERDAADIEWLQLLLNNEKFWEKGGSAQPFVKVKATLEREIPLPPLAEQKRIVAKLDRLSARSGKAKEYLAAVQTLATRAKQATLAAAFRGEWETKPLSDLACVGTGATPKKGNPRFYENGSIPWVTSRVANQDLVTKAEQYITEDAINETNCKVYPSGTLLVAMYGEGKTRGMVAKLGIDAATNQALAAIQLKELERLHPEWVSWLLQSKYLEMREMAAGGVQPNLNLRIIKAIEVPLPNLPKQTEIIRRIETAFAKIDRMAEEASRAADLLGRLDQQLLAKAFRGELVPQDPNDEPASALLARIREARANAPKPKRRRKSAKA